MSDADIWHAVRTAIRTVEMDDDLTMLIGPARDGAPLLLGPSLKLTWRASRFDASTRQDCYILAGTYCWACLGWGGRCVVMGGWSAVY